MPSIDTLSIRISASTADANTKVKALTDSLNKLVQTINALDVSKFDSLASATTNLSQGLVSLKGAGVKQIEKVGKAISSVNDAAQKDTLGTVAKDVQNVSDKSKEAAESLESVGDTFGKFDTSATDEMKASMDAVSDTVKRTSGEMGMFKRLLADTKIIIPTEGLDKVNKKISSLSEKVEDLKDRMNFKSQTQAGYVNSEEMEKDQEKIEGLINEIDRLKLKKQELESHGGFRLNTSFGEDIAKAGKSLGNLIKKVDTFVSKIRLAKAHTSNTAKATNDFSIASTKLAKELTRVTKMLKLMVTRMILRKVIQGVIDGFKNLIQYSSEVDASVSLVWNSFRQLGNAVAAAVGPLISALAPALNYIIQLCIRVANAINQVIAALTGRSTWIKAKSLTDDYGKSLDKTKKSANELKRTILGFDEINQLQDNKGGSGNELTKPEDMFEEAEIESKWNNLAKKLQSILKQLLAPIKAAWEAIGPEVVAAWTGAFKSIQKLLGDIGKDFLTMWNQPRTLQALKTILQIFKDIGGIVKYLADGLDKAWNTNHTGLRLLEAIRDIFLDILIHIRNMSFATLLWAKNLNFTPLLEAFKDWVISMKPVVDAIAGAFEDFYIKVLLPLGKWSIEKGLPELIQVFTDFNNKVEWKTIRERLNRVWEALEPFAEKVGEGLIIFIRDVSNAVANFLNSDNWDAFIDTLIKWMNNVKPEDIANGLKLISGAFMAFKGLSFLVSVISSITSLASALSGLAAMGTPLLVFGGIIAALTVGIYSFVASFGGVSEALGRLKAAFDEIGKAVQDVAQKIDISGKIETLKGAFGGLIDQLGNMKAFWEILLVLFEKVGTIIGVWLVEQIGSGIRITTSFINLISDSLAWIEALCEAILGIFTLNGDKVKEAASKLWEALKKTFQDGAKLVGDVVHWFAGTIIAFFEGIKYALIGDPIVIDMWEGIKKVFSDAINAVIGFVDNLKKKVVELFEAMKKSVGDILDGIVKTFNTFKDSIKKKVSDLISSVKDKVSSFKSSIKNHFAGIRDSIKLKLDEIKRAFESFISKVKGFFSKDKWTLSGIAEGLKSSFEKAKEGIKEVWNSIADKLNGTYKIGSTEFTVELPKFAKGGFPEDGLFFANHDELVGRFDNGKTAVANNAQIVEGIRLGVYEAVTMALNTSQGNNGTSYINNTIQIDGETIARAVTKGQRSIDRRYSPTMA